MGHDGAGSAPAPRRAPGGPAKGDRRRQAIIDAVERLLREQTIAQLAVESIAAEAGISRSGFYFYFESKYAALREALADVATEIVVAGDAFFAPTGEPPEQMLPRALADVADLWERHADLMIAVVDAAHTDAGGTAMWQAWVERLVELIGERIDRGRADGEMPPGAPGRDLARVITLTNTAVFDDLESRRASPDERRAALAAVSQVWLASIWGTRANVA